MAYWQGVSGYSNRFADSLAEDFNPGVEVSKADTKPYTNSRPSFRKGVVEEVWENEVFEGNRLDYDNTAFKIRSGVDGVSKSVGNADIVYGKITYILDDVDGDILGIYDAKTGVLTQQFVYDSDLGWLLKWVEEI